MSLPASYRWADDQDGGAHLYRNYGCVASIKPDGTTKLKYWQKEFHAKAASVAQAKRFIEKWINARDSPRAHECARWRTRHLKKAGQRPSVKRIDYSHIYSVRPHPTSCSSSRIVRIDSMPDDFESIADVGQSLQHFMRSSDLNVTAESRDAPNAQRGTNKVAQPRYAPK